MHTQNFKRLDNISLYIPLNASTNLVLYKYMHRQRQTQRARLIRLKGMGRVRK